MEFRDSTLANVLKCVTDGIKDDSHHFVIYAQYSFCSGRFTNHAPVYFHKNEIFEIKFLSEFMECRVYPVDDKDSDRLKLLIRYDEIDKISQIQDPEFENELILYQRG